MERAAHRRLATDVTEHRAPTACWRTKGNTACLHEALRGLSWDGCAYDAVKRDSILGVGVPNCGYQETIAEVLYDVLACMMAVCWGTQRGVVGIVSV